MKRRYCMIFNKHLELEGKHALLSPSKPYWLNYDDEALEKFYISSFATDIGTIVHEFAADRINMRMPLDVNNEECKNTLLMYLFNGGIPFRAIDLDRIFYNLVPYVNDGIGFRMETEVKLKYSDLCYGTADAIVVRKNQLQIHDLKTGTAPAHMDQLLAYAALFFLEYKRDYRPSTIKTELRIYQNQDITIHKPTEEEIRASMDRIIHDDKVLSHNTMEV